VSSLNRISLIGNLGKDPEVRRTNNGDMVVNFSMACTESWRDKATGERKDRTEWFSVVIWNEGIAKVAEQYLKKGSKLYLEGAMKSRKYTDKDGVERTVWEVVLDRFNGTLVLLGDPGGQREQTSQGSTQRERTLATSPQRPIDDEIPF
jgi:single-strand DNA-binding protein